MKSDTSSKGRSKKRPPKSAITPSFDSIEVLGAKAHNLKNVSLKIPREKFVVITGPSGSGKSSLAFDTIYAEGQRRYVESLSTYARQFVDQLEKPDVKGINGLSPTISIEQKTRSFNPRSTVGTVTEIYDYFRLLFARIAKPFCYNCQNPIQTQTQQQIVDQILTYPKGTRLSILAPVVRGREGEYKKELYQLRQKGFVRVKIDGEVYDLSDQIDLDRNKKHDLSVYVDRLILKGEEDVLTARLSEAVELALKLGQGLLIGETSQEETLFSELYTCPNCNINYPEPEPRTFSFNSPMGACPHCDGLGFEPYEEEEEEVEEEAETLPDDVEWVEEDQPCSLCNGARLKKESLHFKIQDQSIADLCALTTGKLLGAVQGLDLTERENLIAGRILKEIRERLEFLDRVGVSYLSLDRSADTLSGGESQRIRLATQIGSSLVDVVYVLDEPSIGLHPRDNDRLYQTLFRLRDLGNSVLVIEHDREAMVAADWIVDMGPGAGKLGGEVVAAGEYQSLCKDKKSVTGKYLSDRLEIEVPNQRRKADPEKVLRLEGLSLHNLKSIDVEIPLGLLVCVTGVSGSGKSSFVVDTLYPLLLEHVYDLDVGELSMTGHSGLEHIDKVIDIDQNPIGRTPRSNPATYIGLFTLIRDLFTQLPESKIRGYKKGRFSFNVKGGRCETCQGAGMKKVEMHFLPDVFVQCDVCRGRRYNRETLEIRYKGKNIAEVLELTVDEAFDFFEAVPFIKNRVRVLKEVGLGYVHLGQAATTLSGGEAQRIKLSRELVKRSTGKTVYILDEPTTGLHFDDIKKLIQILQTLVDQGNTVLVIEHNTDIMKVSDHIIDIGPEGGDEGGQLVASGTPEEICKVKASHTGRYLKNPFND